MSGREHGLPGSQHSVNMGQGADYNLVAFAQEVAVQRGEAVIAALFHVAAIRSLQEGTGPTGAGANVTCAKAALNDTRASSQGVGQDGKPVKQQAAHLVPGQIYVNGDPVWELVENRSAPTGHNVDMQRLALNTRTCFARTNILHVIFNRADSAGEGAEEKDLGLKWLFASAAKSIWKESRVDPDRPLRVDDVVVVAALKHYFVACTGIYVQAAADKAKAATVLGLATPKGKERDEERQILEVYAESYRVANPMRIVDSKLPRLREQFL